MTENKYWFKFILTGKPNDYLNYKYNREQRKLLGGEAYEHYYGRPCNKGNNNKG